MQVARFALNSTVLPPVTETLPVAESARRTLMGLFGRLFPNTDGTKGRSATFSGKDADGEPLQGHRHAFYLPTDEDEDGRLDHLTIFAAEGFLPHEISSIEGLRHLASREGSRNCGPLRALLLGLGCCEDYQPGPLTPARVWISGTPFLAPRFLKKRGTKRDMIELWDNPAAFLVTVLREELARLIARSHPGFSSITLEAIRIESLVDAVGNFRLGRQQLRLFQFKRNRRKTNDDGGKRVAGAFRIELPHSVCGPICLGHSSHFGLGLFMPEVRT